MKTINFSYKRPKLRLNSLFLLKEPQIETETQNEINEPMIENNTLTESNTNSRKHTKLIRSMRKFTMRKKNSITTRRINNSSDPDILFFYFLQIRSKIEKFEADPSIKCTNNISKNFLINSKKLSKVKENINIHSIFYNIYHEYSSENLIEWNDFHFINPLYKYLYLKSKSIQKQIIKYCITSNLKYDVILDSYNKNYTCNITKHNWFLNPRQAYENYFNLFLKESNQKDKEKIKTDFDYLGNNVGDVVVKLNNNGYGKTLIYNGQLFNVYIDDIHSKKNNSNKMVSMHVQDAESNIARKEVIYTESDLHSLHSNYNKAKYSKSMHKLSFRPKNYYKTVYSSPKKKLTCNVLNYSIKNHTAREINNKDKKRLEFFFSFKLAINKKHKARTNEYIEKNKRNYSSIKNNYKEFPFLFKHQTFLSTNNCNNKCANELTINNYIGSKNGKILNEKKKLSISPGYHIIKRNNDIKKFFFSRSKDLYY